ncbi:MAG: ATP-binding cassette domain-containing protein, partial [Pseudomonadota bacterium]
MLQAEQLEQAAQMRVREITENAEVIEALGMREQLQTKWRDEFDRSDAAIVGSGNLLGGFVAGTKAFRMFLQSGVLGLGAYLTIIGSSTAGAMIAASIITGRAIAPLEQLVGQWRAVTLAREAWSALRSALHSESERGGQMELPPVEGYLVCEHVSAGPPRATKPFLKDIHFSIEPGDVVGIIGSSAAGKSTLGRILAGVWPAQVGAVRIDGAEMSAWPRAQLGPQLGYLPQRVDLFSGSIRDNIARFQPGVPDERVIEAAKVAGCHDMILRLADGYNTEIGHAGAYLSAGQRQRVGLARAIFGSPAIVILDEPNANLDNHGDVALQTAIAELRERRATTIIIAHRPNAIAQCNKVLMLEDGRVRAFGPREDVLAKVAPKQAGTRVTPIRKGDANG